MAFNVLHLYSTFVDEYVAQKFSSKADVTSSTAASVVDMLVILHVPALSLTVHCPVILSGQSSLSSLLC